MKIGKYNLSFLETGLFSLDGGAMFGIIPKPLWEKSIVPDEKNRIKMDVRCLLLQSDSKKILVDTGMGNLWDEKSTSIYNIDQTENNLQKSLKLLNVDVSEITDVILTHLHFDHTGGSTKIENDKIIPAFSNANYFVQKKHFEWANNPTDRDKGSFIPKLFLPLVENGVLKFLDGDEYFDNEIQMLNINGHTIAQQMVKISDSSNTFLFCGDLIPTMYHIPIPYVMGYDIQPLETVKEKKRFLQLAVDENWKIVFEHDHQNAFATIKKTEKGFTFDESFKELL